MNKPFKILTRKQAVAKLWELGRIAEMKLHDSQMEIYKEFQASEERIYLLNCSRRWGKSFLLTSLAFEQALKHPGSQIRYAAPTAKMIKKYIMPLIRELTDDCPPKLKPKYKTQDGVLVFPNESEIHICGTDQGRAEGLRGTGMDLGLVDEAAFVDKLDYVINDILMPQTLTTGGRIMIASTPPSTFDHPYIDYVEHAKASNAYATRTIYDNPLLGPKDIEDAIKYAKGRHTNTFRREYMAELIVDTDFVIVPEFDAEAEEEIVQEVERPKHFDSYVSMDLGYVDNTAVLFGFWDFTNAQLVIEDELLMNKVTSDIIAGKTKATEKRLWGDKAPTLRVSDVDLQTIADLSNLHGLNIVPTAKDNLEVAVNMLRMLVYERRLRIHPRCTNLIAQLRFAVWDRARVRFGRSDKHGHYDALAALIYMLRNVAQGKNPYPGKYDHIRGDDWVVQHKQERTGSDNAFLTLFSPKKHHRT